MGDGDVFLRIQNLFYIKMGKNFPKNPIATNVIIYIVSETLTIPYYLQICITVQSHAKYIQVNELVKLKVGIQYQEFMKMVGRVG